MAVPALRAGASDPHPAWVAPSLHASSAPACSDGRAPGGAPPRARLTSSPCRASSADGPGRPHPAHGRLRPIGAHPWPRPLPLFPGTWPRLSDGELQLFLNASRSSGVADADGAGAASAPTSRSPSAPPSPVEVRPRRARVRRPSRPPLCGWTTGPHRAAVGSSAHATAREARA